MYVGVNASVCWCECECVGVNVSVWVCMWVLHSVILDTKNRGPVTFPPLVGPCSQRLGSPKNYLSKKPAPPLKTKESNHHCLLATFAHPTNGLSIFLAQKTSS